MYCVKCRTVTNMAHAQNFISKNHRPTISGKCAVCGRTKTQFVSLQKAGDLVRSLNAVTSGFKLPWAKFPGEMHFFQHNFIGPGTHLNQRLNPDLMPMEWSKPINRVDTAAYQHDLAYAKHRDTANRNIADKIMVNQLNSIPNPTLREQMERAIVTSILATKEKFGLGIKKAGAKNSRKSKMDRRTRGRITQASS